MKSEYMSKRLLFADILRCVFIIFILISHVDTYWFRYYCELELTGLFDCEFRFIDRFFAISGFLGFFMLSGFVLTHRHINERKLHYFEFLKKRILRIFPLYYIAIILFILLGNEISLRDLILHILGLQSLFYGVKTLPALWFVGTIFEFYLIFPILLRLLKKRELYFWFFCIMLCVGFIVPCLFHDVIYVNIYHFIAFISGIYLAKIYKNLRGEDLRWTAGLFSLLLFSMGITTLYILYTVKYMRHMKAKYMLMGTIDIYMLIWNIMIVSFFIILLLLFERLNLQNSNFEKLMFYLSYSSYGMFLFHNAIWMLILKIYAPGDMFIRGILLIFLGIPLIFAFSYTMQKGYDGVRQSLHLWI